MYLIRASHTKLGFAPVLQLLCVVIQPIVHRQILIKVALNVLLFVAKTSHTRNTKSCALYAHITPYICCVTSQEHSASWTGNKHYQ